MARIELDHVSKVYGGIVQAVDALTLDIADGDFLVIVGPAGSGKSTAPRMVAGLEDITEGEIRIAGRVVNNLPPRDRDKEEQRRRVAEAARLLGLEPFLNRKPAALTGASASGWPWAGRSSASPTRS